jgi:hypothetical protein
MADDLSEAMAGIGQRRPHALGIGGFGNRTDWPVRRDPLAGGMGEVVVKLTMPAIWSMAVV